MSAGRQEHVSDDSQGITPVDIKNWVENFKNTCENAHIIVIFGRNLLIFFVLRRQ